MKVGDLRGVVARLWELKGRGMSCPEQGGMLSTFTAPSCRSTPQLGSLSGFAFALYPFVCFTLLVGS
jgi:hypothetical protein